MDLSKQELRKKMRLSRAVVKRTDMRTDKSAGDALLSFAKQLQLPKEIKVIAGYIPIGNEIDVQPMMQYFAEQNYQICLPVVKEKAKPLKFYAYKPGDLLISGPLGTLQPKILKKKKPDLLFVPLLGFDEKGGRLGQGGGFYDRTLNALRGKRDIIVVGVGFEGQRVHQLPTEEFDEPLDGVLTEEGYQAFNETGRRLLKSPQPSL